MHSQMSDSEHLYSASQLFRLRFELGRGSRTILYEGRVLLRHAVHHGHRRVYLVNAGALLT